jgi:ribosomal protein S1
MAFGSQFNENRNPPPEVKPVSEELDRAVVEAMQGLSIEDLMAEALARPEGAGGPALDPSRPLRGGRPTTVQAAEAAPTGRVRSRKGRVVSIRDRSVFVDLGGKSQGLAALDQFESQPGEPAVEPVEVGREYEFIYTGYDAREGLILLARKGAINHGGLEQLRVGDTVDAMVEAANKGGLEMRLKNTRGFMPAGQVDLRFCPDLSVFVGEKMRCRVIEIDLSANKLVLSRRELLEEEQAKLREKTWGELATGQIREGRVLSVQPYGAFVDLGGVDGLLHVSAMSHSRVSDPNKVVKVGDAVQVMVLGIDEEKQRVSLGLKQLMKDPWSTVAEDFPVGTKVTGVVNRILDFGAFVELAAGVDGLVHISEVSPRHISRVGEELQVGQKIEAKVLAIDLEKKRISLSIAQVQREKGAAEAVATGGSTAATTTPESPLSPAVGGAGNKPAKGTRKAPLKGGL